MKLNGVEYYDYAFAPFDEGEIITHDDGENSVENHGEAIDYHRVFVCLFTHTHTHTHTHTCISCHKHIVRYSRPLVYGGS